MQRGESLSRHYASADLFCFPSLSETFGNVTLEAMASGLATVAFDYGAAREHLCNGAHGASAAFGDEEGFAQAFHATALRRDLGVVGAAARESVLHLHPGKVAADFAMLLGSLGERRMAA